MIYGFPSEQYDPEIVLTITRLWYYIRIIYTTGLPVTQ